MARRYRCGRPSTQGRHCRTLVRLHGAACHHHADPLPDTVPVKVWLTPAMAALVDHLVATGLVGEDRGEAILSLARDRAMDFVEIRLPRRTGRAGDGHGR
jgi:hypothetical protein